MRQRNALAAVLVGCHLRNDLCGNVAGGRKAVGFINASTRNHSAVLQHIFQIDQRAVKHVLGKIVGIVEMNSAIIVSIYNIFREKQIKAQIFGDFAVRYSRQDFCCCSPA